ncbi:MAG: CaiB/BaiF CoA-transferase family protein [Pusillimonas sp.]
MTASSSNKTQGALAGLRILEFAGLGPAPFACMMLADMGADIITLTRPGTASNDFPQVISRGRRVCEVDLKDPDSIQSVKTLIKHADVLIEGFRPGVMERLGIGPEQAQAINTRLIYGRMTGWGQTGPKAHLAGHDINYIALTGALHATGSRNSGPVQPLNLLGDYGGGSLYLLVGILAALVERNRSGLGQVIDAAITDGVLSMMTLSCEQGLRGQFTEERCSNLLDGGTPWYGVYETADGKHISIGSLEPQFFALLCQKLDLSQSLHNSQNDASHQDQLRATLKQRFASKTRDEWGNIFKDSDACVMPVLTLSEAATDPHNIARNAFVNVDNTLVPAPAPKLSRTPSTIKGLSSETIENLSTAIRSWTP